MNDNSMKRKTRRSLHKKIEIAPGRFRSCDLSLMRR